MNGKFLPNFVQSVFDRSRPTLAGGTLVVGGDGRFFNKQACQLIIKMAIANGIDRLWVGKAALLSTPAASAVIRTRGRGGEPVGAFILSASHNPGGIDEDFGIKWNGSNGAPAPEAFTTSIFEKTKTINHFKVASLLPDVDVSKVGVTKWTTDDGREVKVEVIDPADDHVALLQKVFDFGAIKKLVNRKDFSMLYDCMNGVQGPYARRVFMTELGLGGNCLLNATPREDFGGKESAHHGTPTPTSRTPPTSSSGWVSTRRGARSTSSTATSSRRRRRRLAPPPTATPIAT